MQTVPGRNPADEVYQLHHAGCPTCRAAGANPHTQQRCPEGTQLWTIYQSEGMPPHFTWLKPRTSKSK